jgi:hypothetical protein
MNGPSYHLYERVAEMDSLRRSTNWLVRFPNIILGVLKALFRLDAEPPM